jgi:hypothetical protein
MYQQEKTKIKVGLVLSAKFMIKMARLSSPRPLSMTLVNLNLPDVFCSK